jgi:hypothetical protein
MRQFPIAASLVFGLSFAVGLTPVSAQQPQPAAPGRTPEVQVGVPKGATTDDRSDQAARARAAEERKKRAERPAPRSSDGHVILGPTETEKGLWLPGPVIPNPLGIASIPYQPWARGVAADRRRAQLEPHARCKPSGVARQFLTPYGVEIVDLAALQRAYIFDVGGPHTYRTVYMDGRKHPAETSPDFYGHSIGWWEGDTLVVDTVGFNENFWIDRGTMPHTTRLHTIERFTRRNFGTMHYELTVDDPGAYTATFGGQMDLQWEPDVELFEYVCQESNFAPDLMLRDEEAVGRTSTFVP